MTTHVSPQAQNWSPKRESDVGYHKVIGYVPASTFTLAQNDIIQMVWVPQGAVVTDITLLTGDLGSSITADVGDGDTEDLYISAGDVATAACVIHMESAGLAGVPKVYSADDTIDVKLEGGNPADNVGIALIVGYVTGVDITP